MATFTKTSGGYYRTRYELVVEHPLDWAEGAILERCIALLEADIKRYPSEWLWSHKRWKHKRPVDQPLNERLPVANERSQND